MRGYLFRLNYIEIRSINISFIPSWGWARAGTAGGLVTAGELLITLWTVVSWERLTIWNREIKKIYKIFVKKLGNFAKILMILCKIMFILTVIFYK